MSYVRPEIAAMEGYRPGEQPQVGKFIKLNTNENPYPASAAVAHAIGESLQQGLQKYPDAMATAFRNRAAEVYGVEPDWILCGNGSDDILTIMTRAYVAPGQRVRLPYPSYVLYKTLAQIQGADAEEITFQPDWSLPPAFAAADPQVRLAFLPNPNSPTGTMVGNDRILAMAEQLTCPLLVDEAYADFADTNAIELVRQNERILVSRTLSKSYGLAGLRFGFVIGQPQMIEQLLKVKDSYNCDALSIAGATAAINDQKWLEENRARIIASRQRLEDGLRRLGFHVIPSQANFVWCEHPDGKAKEMYEHLKSQRVLVRYMKYEGWSEGLRISVGTDDQLDICLTLLQQFLGQSA